MQIARGEKNKKFYHIHTFYLPRLRFILAPRKDKKLKINLSKLNKNDGFLIKKCKACLKLKGLKQYIIDILFYVVYLSICLSVYLSICLSVYLLVCLSDYLSIYLNTCFDSLAGI